MPQVPPGILPRCSLASRPSPSIGAMRRQTCGMSAQTSSVTRTSHSLARLASALPSFLSASAKGKAVVKRLLAGEQVGQKDSGLSAREWRELMDSLGRA